MDVSTGFLSPQQKDEFVRQWLGPGDPTGLTLRFEKPQPKATEEPSEPDQARTTTDERP